MKKNKKPRNDNNEDKQSTSLFFALFINFLKPSAYSKKIEDIDIKSLKEQGIKMIICDLDNTLVPHFTKFPTKVAIEFVKEAQEADIDFLILSNNSKKRVSFFADKLNVQHFIANAKKPFPWAMKKAIKDFGYDISEVVMIGDLIITDILAANILRIESILVYPLVDSNIALNSISKWLEKEVFAKLSKDNLLLQEEDLIKERLTDKYDIL